MKLSEYKIGDMVDIYIYGEKRPATVINVLDKGVEVELDNPMYFTKIDNGDFIVYLDPETYLKRFLVKYSGIIDRIKEG
jgi:hypothetical protein